MRKLLGIFSTLLVLGSAIAAVGAEPSGAANSSGFFIAVGGLNGEVDGEKAEGQFGVIYKTADLVTWEERFKGGPVKEKFNHAVNNLLRCMAYGNGTFVAIGNPKGVVVSKDGTAWEEAETPHGSFCIAFGDGKFLAGTASNLMTSTNGKNWTTNRIDPTIPVWGADGAGHIRNIVSGNGAFVCYGEQRLGTTKDGQTFVAHRIIKEPSHRKSVVAFGAGKFVWLNPETGHQISADGVSWQPLVIDAATQKDQTELLWTGDRFLVKSGKLLFSSINGETWEKSETNGGFRLTAYGNGKLVSFHGWDNTYRTSADYGKSWSTLLKPDVKVSVRCFYYFNGKEIIGLGGG